MIGDGFTDGPDVTTTGQPSHPTWCTATTPALLHLTFAFWDKPFTVIHDCVLGRSCDMDQMAADIRLHFAEMYKAPVMEDWAAQVGVDHA